MAETDDSCSSDDIWVEPEDLTISQQTLLSQQINKIQTEPLPPTQEEAAPHKPHDDHSAPRNNNENIHQNHAIHETPNIHNEANPLPSYTDNDDVQKCSDHATSETSKPPQNNTSYAFPAALKQAYNQLLATNDDDTNHAPNASKSADPKHNNHNNNNNNNNKNIIYDYDNLPISIPISAQPILSLPQLRSASASATSNNNNNNNNNDINTKDSKNKYAKFFARNFFVKKQEKEEKNDTKEAGENDDNINDEEEKYINRIKIKGNTKFKELSDLRLTQKIENAHKGAIYCMEFSKKGDYLASGGQDSVLRIWTVCGSRADQKRWEQPKNEDKSEGNHSNNEQSTYEHEYNYEHVLSVVAYREFTGHRADIIDISWSNGEFILSASIDQTVMLWHTSRTRCLCLFQHSDIVTSVTFHPNEDYLFLSGSFDSRLRLWNILEHRVVDWVQVPTLVTCTTFSVNGKFAIAGLYDGQCFFYSTQGHRLKYVTAIECRNSSGKYRKGRKVTGLQYVPAALSSSGYLDKQHAQNKMEHGSPQLLISTNDSRLRLYNLSNFDMQSKYKGHENTQSQIHARFSPDGKLIICGSEDNNIYLWRVEKSSCDESNSIFQSKKNRQEFYEYFKSNCKLPQVALFAPHRSIYYVYKFRTVMNKNAKIMYKNNEEKIKHIILTADTEGHINIYSNHSSDKEYKYPYDHQFHGHVYNTHHANNKKSKKKLNK